MLIASGCGDIGSHPPNMLEQVKQVRGLVVEVQGLPFDAPNALTIQSSDGQLWEFNIGIAGMFTTSHLNDHKFLGQPVTVFYTETPTGLLVESISD